MVNLEYFDGENWTNVVNNFYKEEIAWITLGGDDFNYRTVDSETGKVLTDKSENNHV